MIRYVEHVGAKTVAKRSFKCFLIAFTLTVAIAFSLMQNASVCVCVRVKW